MKEECLICPDPEATKCPCCKNYYCKIHFDWHLTMKTACRKVHETKHGKLKTEKEA
jgi:hypothetical protein